MGAALVAPMTVMAVMLRRYGAEPQTIGALLAIQQVGLMLPQLLGPLLFRSARSRQKALVAWHVLGPLPFLLVMAAVIHYGGTWQGDNRVRALLWSFACFNAAIGVIIPPWIEWISHLFEQRLRGKVVGATMCLAALAGSGSTWVAGWVMRTIPGDDGFALLFVGAFLLGLVSMGSFILIHDPIHDEPQIIVAPPVRWPELLRRFRDSLRDPNYRNYLVGRVLATLGFTLPPFIPLYFHSELGGGLDEALIVTCSALELLVMAGCNLLLGWLGDRYGHRLGVMIGIISQVLTLVAMLTLPGLAGCLLVFALAGVQMGAAGVSNWNFMVESCPHSNRSAHFTVGNVVLSPICVVAPLAAGALVEMRGLPTVVWGSFGVSVVAALWLLLKVREPRTLKVFDAGGK
jgi:MFS family permease